MGHQKTLRDHASELADTLTPRVEAARTKAAPLLADARDKAAPVLADAREKAAPVIADVRAKAAPVLVDARAKAAPVLADARAKAAPYISDARDKATPYISDARERLATEVLPAVTAALATLDAATEEARHETVKRSKAVAAALKGEVEAPKPKKRRGPLALLLLLTVGGAVFAVSRRLASRKPTTNWQSSYTPPPAPTAGTSSGPAAGVGVEGGLHRAEDAPDDTAASDPAEAVSDATDIPHPATTPDDPVEDIHIDRQ
jgi:F0F1-type ATP synthase membrane subunit b/b'